MPITIPASTVAMLAAMLQLPTAPSGDPAAARWRIVDTATWDGEARVNGLREVASLDDCLRFAGAEGERLELGPARRTSLGPMTQLRFAEKKVAYSCVQLGASHVSMTVNGPERGLREAGYRFGWE